jgi:nucleoside-diphosphate-sugar epimerase
MALLVTGAMGHIGYEVARRAAGSRKVIAQYHRSFRPADAEALGGNVTWAACDLGDAEAVEKLCAAHDIDGCIHLAAMATEIHAKPAPADAFRSNVSAVINLLEGARKQRWKRFIYTSTGSVFMGLDPAAPIPETTPPNAESIYGTTKTCGEVMTRGYRAQYGLEAATVRISWIYGPPIVSDSFQRGPIPSLLLRALQGKPRRDATGGDFSAGFTFVDDVVEGLLAAYDAAVLRHDVYQLGPPRNYSTYDVAEAVKAAVPGAVVEVGPGGAPWDKYSSLRGPFICDRLAADTGFRAGHTLEMGVKRYADWLSARPQLWRDIAFEN